MSTNKYSLSNLNYHKSSIQIGEIDFYDFLVKEQAVSFINNREPDILQMIKDGDGFDRDARVFGGAFREFLESEITTESKASLVLDQTSNLEDDAGIHENDRVQQASFSFQNDVSSKCEEIVAEIAERYDEINADVDEILDGIVNGRIKANPQDPLHIVAINAYAEYHDLEGDFLSRYEQIKNSEEILSVSEDLDLSQQFAAHLAFREKMVESEESLYPSAVAPGSIAEAGVLVGYLEAAERSSYGGYGVGGSYIDIRSEADIADYMFAEYQDNAVMRMLGAYQSSVDVDAEHERRVAFAMRAGFKEEHVELTPEASLFIGPKTVPVPAQSGNFDMMVGHAAALVGGELGREITQRDYESLAANRDVHGLNNKQLTAYLSVMHPEAARLHRVGTELDVDQMQRLLAGLVDNAASAKEGLVALRESINSSVPVATPALKAFRVQLNKDLGLEAQEPQGPAL